jgi:hypothetical protein
LGESRDGGAGGWWRIVGELRVPHMDVRVEECRLHASGSVGRRKGRRRRGLGVQMEVEPPVERCLAVATDGWEGSSGVREEEESDGAALDTLVRRTRMLMSCRVSRCDVGPSMLEVRLSFLSRSYHQLTQRWE